MGIVSTRLTTPRTSASTWKEQARKTRPLTKKKPFRPEVPLNFQRKVDVTFSNRQVEKKIFGHILSPVALNIQP
jgi:hypothetical protein